MSAMATRGGPRHFDDALRAELRARVRGAVRFDEPMRLHTSWRVGGPAEAFVAPADTDDLVETVKFAHGHALPKLLVGGGSNLLVLDGGIPGLVIDTTFGLRSLHQEGALVVAEGGCRIGRLLTFCATRGRAGLEFLADIPGTVGGVVLMNAGAMGGEVKDVARWLDIAREDGQRARIDATSVPFVYRHAPLPEGCVVLNAALETHDGEPKAVQARISEIRRKRRAAQPQGASAGSTFKNPPGDFAGRLIEAAGLKGRRVGDAEISVRHANFIVNVGQATAKDVQALVQLAQEEVRRSFQVELELEVKVVGLP